MPGLQPGNIGVVGVTPSWSRPPQAGLPDETPGAYAFPPMGGTEARGGGGGGGGANGDDEGGW